MNTTITPKILWDSLLDIGAFSIGPFVVSMQTELVRVYHMRTKNICHCSRKSSFYEIQRLCSQRGYTFHYLLTRSLPESFQPFSGHNGQSTETMLRTEQLTHTHGHGIPETAEGVKEESSDSRDTPGEKTKNLLEDVSSHEK